MTFPRFAHEAMGTVFEIWISGHPPDYARQVCAALFAEIDRLEKLFSRFDPASDISRIGRLAPGESLTLSADVFECLNAALRLREETGGAFAIDYESLVEYPGPDPKSPERTRRPPPPGFRLARTPGRFTAVRNPGEGPGTHLDLGGIGKGFALDRCAEQIADWSIESALLHGGTSTVLGVGSGPDPAAPGKWGWPVGFGRAGRPGFPARAWLLNRALSGSGREVKGEHVMDPRSGGAASGHGSAWVACRFAAEADALSTALLVMDPGEAEDFFRRRPDVWAMSVSDEGKPRIFNPGALDTEAGGRTDI